MSTDTQGDALFSAKLLHGIDGSLRTLQTRNFAIPQLRNPNYLQGTY